MAGTINKFLVKKAIEKKGAKLIYLSPYSPDFSPIENLWSKLKIILRSIKTTNYQELGKTIEFAFGQVTASNIFNWYYTRLLLYLIFLRKAINLFKSP
ncbi:MULTISPECIES: transposase [unclassified Microcoleus]|uniref:transposase n=1 Tax=unclassified Microcoleus TaxID=2642155 RepID=UPI004040BFFA